MSICLCAVLPAAIILVNYTPLSNPAPCCCQDNQYKYVMRDSEISNNTGVPREQDTQSCEAALVPLGTLEDEDEDEVGEVSVTVPVPEAVTFTMSSFVYAMIDKALGSFGSSLTSKDRLNVLDGELRLRQNKLANRSTVLESSHFARTSPSTFTTEMF